MNTIIKHLPRKLLFITRYTFLLAVISLGLVSIIATGGGSGGTPTYYLDQDGDGYGDPDVFLKQDTQPDEYVTNSADCDDSNAEINPDASDVPDDGVDQNCDGFDLKSWFEDADGDGYGNPDVFLQVNAAPDGYVTEGIDCDDTNAGVFPGNTEIANDGIDQDCDGFDLFPWYRDADGDGYGDPYNGVMERPAFGDYVENNKDCDDTDAGAYPGAPEIADDGIDQDCDGFDLKSWFLDADSDGYGDPDTVVKSNSAPGGYVANNDDCNDENAGIYPGACDAPDIFLTVNDIPASMNGSTPYRDNNNELVDFTLAVPTSGAVWNITVDCPCGCRKDGLQVWSDPPMNENPADLFESDGNGRFTWRVDAVNALPQTAALTMYAAMTDNCGQESETASLTVRTIANRPLLAPFDLQDPWLFVYSRDNYTITSGMPSDTTWEVYSEAVPNDISDFIEDLWSLGLGTPTPDPAFEAVTCENGQNGNDCLARMALEQTREKAYQLFLCEPDGTRDADGVDIRLWIEGEPGAPDPAEFTPQTLNSLDIEKTFSMMGFGGGDLEQYRVGYAERIDYLNLLNEDNTPKNLGILTTSLVRYAYNFLNDSEALELMAAINLGDILVPVGGIPIGTYAEDVRVIDLSIPSDDLSERFQSRREQMLMLMNKLTDGLSLLTVHEIGHSVGLVPPGHPPYGFFAGETKADFIDDPDGSTEAHIDTAGFNIMQAGPETGYISEDLLNALTGSLFEEDGPVFRFNEMNMAYLQGRLLLLP